MAEKILNEGKNKQGGRVSSYLRDKKVIKERLDEVFAPVGKKPEPATPRIGRRKPEDY